MKALATILDFWIRDDVFKEDEYGSNILQSLERVRRFNRWMTDEIAPHVGDRVLEIGAGIGNLSSLLAPRTEYMVSDVNPAYLSYLHDFMTGKPYMEVRRIDLEDPSDFCGLEGRFDTVICLNVLEHVREPVVSLRNIRRALAPNGRAVLYVPQSQRLFSSLDEVLGHRCRYEVEQLRTELEEADLEPEGIRQFNRLGRPGWWWNGVVLRRKSFGRVGLQLFDMLVPMARVFDRHLPWRGLGMIAVARRRAQPEDSPQPSIG